MAALILVKLYFLHDFIVTQGHTNTSVEPGAVAKMRAPDKLIKDTKIFLIFSQIRLCQICLLSLNVKRQNCHRHHVFSFFSMSSAAALMSQRSV